MKKRRVFFFLSLLVALPAAVYPATLPRYFTFTNLDEFPGYTFHYRYQTYPYHNSFQKGPLERVPVFQDSLYKGGDYYDAVYLEAEAGDGSKFRSNILVGGRYYSDDPSVTSVYDRFEIRKIDQGIISLNCRKEIVSRHDGTLDERLGLLFSGEIISPGAAGRMGLMAAPLIFGLLVALFFSIRSAMAHRMK